MNNAVMILAFAVLVTVFFSVHFVLIILTATFVTATHVIDIISRFTYIRALISKPRYMF